MIMTSFIKSSQSINQSPHSWSRTGYISRALHFSQLTPCFPIQDGRMDQFVEPCSSLHNILSHKSTPKTEDSRFECSAALSSAWPLASDKSLSAVNQSFPQSKQSTLMNFTFLEKKNQPREVRFNHRSEMCKA